MIRIEIYFVFVVYNLRAKAKATEERKGLSSPDRCAGQKADRRHDRLTVSPELGVKGNPAKIRQHQLFAVLMSTFDM